MEVLGKYFQLSGTKMKINTMWAKIKVWAKLVFNLYVSYKDSAQSTLPTRSDLIWEMMRFLDTVWLKWIATFMPNTLI